MPQIILTASCPVRPGIVAAISIFLAEQGCNIHDSSQFSDIANDRFFMRLSFESESGVTRAALTEGFAAAPPMASRQAPGFPRRAG